MATQEKKRTRGSTNKCQDGVKCVCCMVILRHKMTLSEYSYLKQQICIGVGKSERHTYLLDTLKSFFSKEINSPRRLEKIKKINQLLAVLELRDALSEDNVGPLRHIAQLLPNNAELAKKISHYEASHVPRPSGNYYVAPQNPHTPLNKGPAAAVSNHNLYGPMSAEKGERILRTVVEEIGKNWMDLARNLKITERNINEIDQTYKSLANKATKLLQVYLNHKADPDKWFFELCEALEKSRRKDLSQSITRIFTMNI